jgi:hypothetical protein
MAIHQEGNGYKVDPVNGVKALLLERAEDANVKLTAVFGLGLKSEAVLKWQEAWDIANLKDGKLRDFPGSGLQKAIKGGSILRLFFVPTNDGDDLVCVASEDLQEALRAVKPVS